MQQPPCSVHREKTGHSAKQCFYHIYSLKRPLVTVYREGGLVNEVLAERTEQSFEDSLSCSDIEQGISYYRDVLLKS